MVVALIAGLGAVVLKMPALGLAVAAMVARLSAETSPGAQTMKCPSCPETALVMSDRQGVEIDYCLQCRGVWLDRDELDELIQRSSAMAPAPASDRPARSQPQFAGSDHEHGRSPQAAASSRG